MTENMEKMVAEIKGLIEHNKSEDPIISSQIAYRNGGISDTLFVVLKYLNAEENIDGEVVTGRRMSDGEPVTGFVIGTTPFTYILPEDEVRKACCTGEQQVKIEITAERILAHD